MSGTDWWAIALEIQALEDHLRQRLGPDKALEIEREAEADARQDRFNAIEYARENPERPR